MKPANEADDAAPDHAAADRCPRCGAGFRCGMQGAAPCACTTVRVDGATLAALSLRYRGCLCLRCLAELAEAPGNKGAAADVSHPP